MDYKTADRLIELRRKHGYSQDQLADKLEISRQAISKWERAESLPDTENLIRLANLYRISIDELIHGVDTKVSTGLQHSKKPVLGNNMKVVRSTFGTVSKVHIIVGLSLLGVAGILLGLAIAISNHYARLALGITGGTFAFSGLVELTIGIVFCIVVKKGDKRLARLKNTGLQFQAQSIEVKRMAGFRAGRRISARLECLYINHQGKTCLVKSKFFLTDKKADYNVIIYVNPQDPTDYAIEIFSQPSQGQGMVDYDYR
ncbi:MAG: helix-turn-helix domain-containing protein [Firmicutes bacterium]|nr:helix-turn-helix domain-containing protein [Bacillota bacterium]